MMMHIIFNGAFVEQHALRICYLHNLLYDYAAPCSAVSSTCSTACVQRAVHLDSGIRLKT